MRPRGKDIDQKQYRRGSHTVTDLKCHFVWRTKYSHRVPRDDVALREHDIIREIRAAQGLDVVKGSIRPDHIHILIGAPADYCPAKIARILKGKSSYPPRRESPCPREQFRGRRPWCRGYFCSTVGAVPEEQIRQVIANQSDEAETFEDADEPLGIGDGESEIESDFSG